MTTPAPTLDDFNADLHVRLVRSCQCGGGSVIASRWDAWSRDDLIWVVVVVVVAPNELLLCRLP